MKPQMFLSVVFIFSRNTFVRQTFRFFADFGAQIQSVRQTFRFLADFGAQIQFMRQSQLIS